ncbi:unnamed protein product [Lampetra fluviatilis]
MNHAAAVSVSLQAPRELPTRGSSLREVCDEDMSTRAAFQGRPSLFDDIAGTRSPPPPPRGGGVRGHPPPHRLPQNVTPSPQPRAPAVEWGELIDSCHRGAVLTVRSDRDDGITDLADDG